MNWFGKKKTTAPTTVSATSTARPTDPQTTIVTLRETIANQEKRYVILSTNSNSFFDVISDFDVDFNNNTPHTFPLVCIYYYLQGRTHRSQNGADGARGKS
jgi:hypothetical protein